MANILYKKQKQQKSLDNGVTWIDTGEYRVGEVLEKPSNCSASGDINQCRWIDLDASEGYYCDGIRKYTVQVEECTENGTIWTRTGNQRKGSTLLDADSIECGYVPTERWVVSGDPIVCDCGSVIYYEYKELYDDGVWTPTGEKRESEDFAITSGWTCYETEENDPLTTQRYGIEKIYEYKPKYNLVDSFYHNGSFITLEEEAILHKENYGEVYKYDYNQYIQMNGEYHRIHYYKTDEIGGNVYPVRYAKYDGILYVKDNYLYLIYSTDLKEDGAVQYEREKILKKIDLTIFETSSSVLDNISEVVRTYIGYWGDYVLTHNFDAVEGYSIGFYDLNQNEYVTNTQYYTYNYANLSDYYPHIGHFTSDSISNAYGNICNFNINQGYIPTLIGKGVIKEGDGLFQTKIKVVTKPYNYGINIAPITTYITNGNKYNYTTDYDNMLYVDTYNESKAYDIKSFIYNGTVLVNKNGFYHLNYNSDETINSNNYEFTYSTFALTANPDEFINGVDIYRFKNDTYTIYDTYYTVEYYGGIVNYNEEGNPIVTQYDVLINDEGDSKIENKILTKNEDYSVIYNYELYRPEGDSRIVSGTVFIDEEKIGEFKYIQIGSAVTSNYLNYTKEGSGTNCIYVNNTKTCYTYYTSPIAVELEELHNCYQFFTEVNELTNVYSFPDTSNVTNMQDMFYGCSGVTFLDLSTFDTSNVTTMRYMFRDCKALNTLHISSFNTINVTDMCAMFAFASSNMKQLNLSNFDTSNVTTMNYMFGSASGLTSLDLSSFNTSNVTDMEYMFKGCEGLTSLDLSSFNTSNVTTMKEMFRDCKNIEILDLSNFNTSNVTAIQYIFNGCAKLKELNLSGWDLSNVDTSSAVNDIMFTSCNSLETIYCYGCNQVTIEILNKRKPADCTLVY